jgi:hypothetical protein
MRRQEKTNEYFLLSICGKQISNNKAAEYRQALFISNSHKGITASNIAVRYGWVGIGTGIAAKS